MNYGVFGMIWHLDRAGVVVVRFPRLFEILPKSVMKGRSKRRENPATTITFPDDITTRACNSTVHNFGFRQSSIHINNNVQECDLSRCVVGTARFDCRWERAVPSHTMCTLYQEAAF